MSDPKRLLEDDSLSESLRSDLSLAASDPGPALDASAGLERLLASMAALPPASADPTGSGDASGGAGGPDLGGLESIPPPDGGATAALAVESSSATASTALAQAAASTTTVAGTATGAAAVTAQGAAVAVTAKSGALLLFGGGSVLVGALVAGTVALSDGTSATDPPPVTPVAAVASSLAAPKNVGPAPTPSAASGTPTELDAGAATKATVATPVARRPIPAPSAQPSDKRELIKREIAQLGEARSALSANPARALELAEGGHVEFRGGMLHQEREAVAIFALQQLGRSSAAKSRGSAFLRAYPAGPFSARVRAITGDAP